MPKLPPFNIQIMDVDDFIQRHSLLPVTSTAIFETGTKRFHPDGLYSEAIFGQVGSRDRLVRKGYIDLHTDIVTPHLYKQLISLRSYYKDIISGKAYAKFDPEIKDLILVDPDEPGADTGFQFFVKSLPKISFARTDSVKRTDKIDLLEKYRDRLIIDKLIVLPAGIRDVKISDDYISPEEINKFYVAILQLASGLPSNKSDEPLYDTIRFQIQTKVMAIYDYITTLIDGKSGFAQGKFAARKLTYGTRNVITALPITRVEDPTSDRCIGPEEIEIPLFQAMKSSFPLIVHSLQQIFFNTVFSNQTNKIPLIDPDSLFTNYVDVDTAVVSMYTTDTGINDLINNYRTPEIQWEPVKIKGKNENGEIKDYYLYLLLDVDDCIRIGRSAADIKEELDTEIRHVFNVKLNDKINLIPENSIITEQTVFNVLSNATNTESITSIELYTKDDIEIEDSSFKIHKLSSKDYDELLKNQSVKINDKVNMISVNRTYEIYKSAKQAYKRDYANKIAQYVYDKKYIRPITWTEMFYLATYFALQNKYTTATRHPMMLIENITIDKIHVMSTTQSRMVRLYSATGHYALLNEYPVYQAPVKVSMSVHPAHLPKYDADHDGDVLGINVLMSDEASKELKDFFEKPISMVSSNRRLTYGLGDGRINALAIWCSTYQQLPEYKKS